MNSASIAKLRLLKDSIQQKKLAELKEVAAELGLRPEDVKFFGNLSTKNAWISAIGNKIAELFDEESATNQHGECGDHTTGTLDLEGCSSDTTITQINMVVTEENRPPLPLSAFRVPDEEVYVDDPNEEDEDEDDEDTEDEDDEDEDTDDDSYLVAGLPQEVVDSLVDAGVVSLPNEDEEDEDEEDEEEEDVSPLVAGLPEEVVDFLVDLGTINLPSEDEDEAEKEKEAVEAARLLIENVREFLASGANYLQLIALHYGLIYAYQEVEPLSDAFNTLGYSDRFTPEQIIANRWDSFVPSSSQVEEIIPLIKQAKEVTIKPDNCCPACEGIGNFFMGLAEHVVDWEVCDVCGAQGFVEPVPNPVNCPDCDGTGEVLNFSGEDYEPCPTCEGKRFIHDPKTDPKLNQPEPTINVNVRVCFPSTDQNSQTISLLAGNFGGVCWFSGFGEVYTEDWSFNSFHRADKFIQSCRLLPFVSFVVCDRVSSNVPLIPPPDENLSPTQASEFEKATVIEWFRSEGSTPEELEEVRRQPMSKAEAAVVLGFAEHYKKSAEIALRLYLVDWVNDVKGERERCANRTDQLTVLLSWQIISQAKAKLAAQFQLRPGEINTFITPDGWRISCPAWTKEEILSPKESEFINPDDPVIQMMGDGYLLALAHFKSQVSVSLADLSPFPLVHETP